MSDTKISALAAAAAAALSNELAINEAGTSKKITLTQVKTALGPTVPTFVAASAEFTSTGVPTAILPTGHTTNDILVLVLQTSNDNLVSAPIGYTRLGPQNGIGIGAAAGANRLCMFWKRDGGSESVPGLSDTGDHTYGMMFAVRGCPTTGDPFALGGNNFKFTTSTTGTSPKSVTTVDNVLIIDVFAGSADNASAEGSSLANTDLTSVTEQFDDGTTDGTGGFIYVASGVKATAGEVKATTVTWANTSVDLCTRLHFIPIDTSQVHNASRGCEIQIFIGSPTDTDDTWIKPTGAKRVHVQTCDGGGSGSSGHTVSTAAGGGGGGGGGYREKWFNADDLAATVTVHAGKGGAATTAAVDQAGNPGVTSKFGVGLTPVLLTGIAGTAATAAASGDGGNGGCGSGSGTVSTAVATTRITLEGAVAGASLGEKGGAGGSGTTANTGGSPAEKGGGGGESGADTDAGVALGLNGYSLYGGGGGGGGRTTGTISVAGDGGGATAPAASVGANGTDSTNLPFGGSGACSGNSTTGPGGIGGFPGGGGGGGGGNIAGTQGGRGGHGCIVVTTYF